MATFPYWILFAQEAPPEGSWAERIWWAFLKALNFIISNGWLKFIVLVFVGLLAFHILTKWLSRIVGLLIVVAAFGVLFFILLPQLSSTITNMLPQVDIPSLPPVTPPAPGEDATILLKSFVAYIGAFLA